MDVYGILREEFLEMIRRNDWGFESIRVTAMPLTPEEAIGHPEDQDYPLGLSPYQGERKDHGSPISRDRRSRIHRYAW
jgi:hypothetical protein